MIFKRNKSKSRIINFTPKFGNRLYDITSLIELALDNTRLRNGLVHIHVQASTAAILIQENGESSVKQDIIHFTESLIQSNALSHTDKSVRNDAHLKASIIGPGKTIPVVKGKLALSKCQKIFLCEFDQPNNQREILITPFRN